MKQKGEGWLFIGLLSLLTVGGWVSFEVYRSITKTTLTTVLQEQTRPLKVDFTEEDVRLINERRFITEEELNSGRRANTNITSATQSSEQSFVINDETSEGTNSTQIINESL